jgi:hypothetical protein
MEVLLAEQTNDKKNQETSECREKGKSGVGIFTVSQLCKSGIGIPALGSVRYRWSRKE